MEDPLLDGRLNEMQCEALVDEMIKATSNYLPDGWKK